MKRFNLLFEDESIEDFKSRIQAALRRRQEVERDARYKAYVDQQPWRNMETLDLNFEQRVMQLAGWELPQKLPELTQTFLSEVRHHGYEALEWHTLYTLCWHCTCTHLPALDPLTTACTL